MQPSFVTFLICSLLNVWLQAGPPDTGDSYWPDVPVDGAWARSLRFLVPRSILSISMKLRTHQSLAVLNSVLKKRKPAIITYCRGTKSVHTAMKHDTCYYCWNLHFIDEGTKIHTQVRQSLVQCHGNWKNLGWDLNLGLPGSNIPQASVA